MAQAKCRKCGEKHDILHQWGISMYFMCGVTGKLEWNGKGQPDVTREVSYEHTLRRIHNIPPSDTGGVQGDLFDSKW